MQALLTLLLWLCLVSGNEEGDGEGQLTNSWAVHIEENGLEAVNEIARRHGFVNQGQIGSLPGYYHFVKNHTKHERTRRDAEQPSGTLLTEPKVKWAEQQRVLERSKRDVMPGEVELVQQSVTSLRRDSAVRISDPFFKDQWYLQNIGQSMGPPGVDINVLPAWGRGYSGKGVVVAILDDGVDHTHPDLKANYDPKASFDFNDNDDDPMPREGSADNCHGTKCAGEVAAEANNGVCGVGVSYNASIGGIRMLDGKATDTLEGSSLSYRSSYIDIYSCCWGPKDDGKRFGKPGHLASAALKFGAIRGRGGKGNIFVWATGNGGMTDDDCNCDGYTTSIYTISIGAISVYGLSTYYTETCASTLAVTFSGGSHREGLENKIVTTDLNHKCTGVFKGTSSSAPLAAGMLALVLEANPTLTWRDVQHLIVETSQVTSPLDEGWMTNGGGKRFNHKFGFGKLDVNRLVEKALVWKNVDSQRTCRGVTHNTKRSIPASGSLILSANTSACALTASRIQKLEHVQLVISLQHRHRGDLSITLISPSGTRSQLLTTRRNDHSSRGLKDWILMTVHFWGENPLGLWTLSITDNDSNNRQHFYKKALHADLEDATEVLMHDSENIGDDKEAGEYGERFQQPVGDHIKKTMEDSEGELFHVSGKGLRKKPGFHHRNHGRHHWKYKAFTKHRLGHRFSGGKRFHRKESLGKHNTKKAKTRSGHIRKLDRGAQFTGQGMTEMLVDGAKPKAKEQTASPMEKPAGLASDSDSPGFKTFVSLDSRVNFSLSGFTNRNGSISRSWGLDPGVRNPLVARLFGMDLTSPATNARRGSGTSRRTTGQGRLNIASDRTQSVQASKNAPGGSGAGRRTAGQERLDNSPHPRRSGQILKSTKVQKKLNVSATPTESGQGLAGRERSNRTRKGAPRQQKVMDIPDHAQRGRTGGPHPLGTGVNSGAFNQGNNRSIPIPQTFGNVEEGLGTENTSTQRRKVPGSLEPHPVLSSKESGPHSVEVGLPGNNLQHSDVVGEQGSAFNVGSGDLEESGSTKGYAQERIDIENRTLDGRFQELINTSSSVSKEENGTRASVERDTTLSGSGSGAHEELVADSVDFPNPTFHSGDGGSGSSARGQEKVAISGGPTSHAGASESADLCSFQNGGDGVSLCAKDKSEREDKHAHKHAAYDRNEKELANYLATDKLRANASSLKNKVTPPRNESKILNRKAHRHADELGEDVELLQDADAPKYDVKIQRINDPRAGKHGRGKDLLRIDVQPPKSPATIHHQGNRHVSQVEENSTMHHQGNHHVFQVEEHFDATKDEDLRGRNTTMHHAPEVGGNFDLMRDEDSQKSSATIKHEKVLDVGKLTGNVEDNYVQKYSGKLGRKDGLGDDGLGMIVDLDSGVVPLEYKSKIRHKSDLHSDSFKETMDPLPEDDRHQEDAAAIGHDSTKSDLKDLSILEEALEEQLTRLPRPPGGADTNYEILSRVRDDIERGDVGDLELLESQLGDKIRPREARGISSDDFEGVLGETEDPDNPGVNNGVLNDDGYDDGGGLANGNDFLDSFNIENNRIEPRRLSKKSLARQWTQKYRVADDKYGKGNSGILESWTLILYGT